MNHKVWLCCMNMQTYNQLTCMLLPDNINVPNVWMMPSIFFMLKNSEKKFKDSGKYIKNIPEIPSIIWKRKKNYVVCMQLRSNLIEDIEMRKKDKIYSKQDRKCLWRMYSKDGNVYGNVFPAPRRQNYFQQLCKKD